MIRTVITGVDAAAWAARWCGWCARRRASSSVGAATASGAGRRWLDAGLAARLGPLDVAALRRPRQGARRPAPQVVIDFTTAEASVAHARACAAAGVALVVGSTGFDAEASARRWRRPRSSVPMVMAPNMSVGVNVVIEVAAQLAQRAGRGLRRGDARDAPPHEEGRALAAPRCGSAEVLAEALGRGPRGSAHRARGADRRAPRAGDRRADRCAAATWWASTPCSSSATASAWSSPTAPPAATSSPRARCAPRAGWSGRRRASTTWRTCSASRSWSK